MPRLTEDDEARLRRYCWPGNVRELQNVIERAIITSTNEQRLNLKRALQEDNTTDVTEPGATSYPTADQVLTVTEMRDLERNNMIRALEKANGKIAGPGGAAEQVGLNPNTFASRMKALGITRR